MLVELGDDITLRVTHIALVDATQGYEINALYTPTFIYLSKSANRPHEVKVHTKDIHHLTVTNMASPLRSHAAYLHAISHPQIQDR